MDSQAQLQRTHGHHQAQEPIRIHHPGIAKPDSNLNVKFFFY